MFLMLSSQTLILTQPLHLSSDPKQVHDNRKKEELINECLLSAPTTINLLMAQLVTCSILFYLNAAS